MGAMPFWESLRRSPRTQAALAGVNAAVVGLLLAALYQPVWTSAIFSARDFGLALIALVALMVWKLPRGWWCWAAPGSDGCSASARHNLRRHDREPRPARLITPGLGGEQLRLAVQRVNAQHALLHIR